MTILETKNLCYTYEDGTNALKNININIKKGSVTSFLGGNGAGKSTLFLNLNGIFLPTSGEVIFNGKNTLKDKRAKNELKKRVGIVFQDPDDQLFSANVYSDISFGAINIGLSKDEVEMRVKEAMENTKITHLKDKPTHNLSFGQKKRVALSGVLVMKPDILILDEPTAGLDPMGVSELMHLLMELKEKTNISIILSTHDIDIVPLYSDYCYILNNGEIIKDGTPKEIFNNPQILRENNLRLPRIAHLMEILKTEDGFNISNIPSTIKEARREIKKCFNKK